MSPRVHRNLPRGGLTFSGAFRTWKSPETIDFTDFGRGCCWTTTPPCLRLCITVLEYNEVETDCVIFNMNYSDVLQVNAVDQDSGENARISYSLQSGLLDSDTFSIDGDTGVITLTKPPSCSDGTCQIIVVARDHGAPNQVNTTTKWDLIIWLIDSIFS